MNNRRKRGEKLEPETEYSGEGTNNTESTSGEENLNAITTSGEKPIEYKKLSDDFYKINEETHMISFDNDKTISQFVLSDSPDGPTEEDEWHDMNQERNVEVQDVEIHKKYVYYKALSAASVSGCSTSISNTNNTTATVRFSLTGVSSEVTGIGWYFYRPDSSGYPSQLEVDTSGTKSGTTWYRDKTLSGTGTYVMHCIVYDAAGNSFNMTAYYPMQVHCDTTNPTVGGFSKSFSNVTSTGATVRLNLTNCADNLAGVKDVQWFWYKYNGSDWASSLVESPWRTEHSGTTWYRDITISSAGTYRMDGFIRDNAGNTYNWTSSTSRSALTVNAVTVSFNANGGSGGQTANVVAINGASMPPISTTAPTRSGYRFDGWYDSASGGTQYYNSSGAGVRNWNKTSNATLYAHWTAVYYLDLNGLLDGASSGNISGFGTADVYINGEQKANDVTDYYVQWPQGTTYTITDIKAASGKTYLGVSSVTGTIGTQKITVVLKYGTNYTVSFNVNGGSGGQSSSVTATRTAGMPPISTTAPTRSGYRFDGWYDSASGGTQYYTSAGASAREYDKASNTTLYAHWTPVYYLDLNGLLDGASSGNISGFGTADVYINGEQKANDVTDYYVQWPQGTTYTITDIKAASGKTYLGVSSVTGTIGTQKITVVLKYGTNYTVSFNVNGGSGGQSSSVTATRTAGMPAISTTAPIKTGYTFMGWYDNATYTSGTQYYTSAGASAREYDKASNTTLYAGWKINSYTNRIDHWTWGYKNGEGNNGNSNNAYLLATTNYSDNYNSVTTLNATQAVTCPNGFTLRQSFVTNAIEGSWKTYAFGTQVTQKPNSMSFEYDYDPINYTITYNMNGGTNNSSNPSTYNVLYGVTLANPTREGYTFAGWYLNNSQITGINVGKNASFTSADNLRAECNSRTTGNLTIEARWTPNTYKVTFNPSGGNVSPTSKTVRYDDTYGALPTPIKSGYTFNNWQQVPEGYQQVEYIESTGTQYIDTGVYANVNTKIELEAMMTDTRTNSTWTQITGERVSYRAPSAIQVAYNPSTQIVAIDYGTYSVTYSNQAISKNTKFNVTLKNNGIYVNGNKWTQNGTFSGTSEYSLYIFDYNDANGASVKSICRIYSYKIYDGDTLVRNFIPCYRISDGRAGLYDTVTNEFYTNPGSDNFEKGSDVNIASSSIVQIPNDHTLFAHYIPNLELVGPNEVGILDGTSYTDAGASVKGLDAEQSRTFNENGYHLAGPIYTKDGVVLNDLYEVSIGEYLVTYNLLNSNNEIVKTVSRKVTVGIGNYSVGSKYYPTLATAYSAIQGNSGIIEVERDNIDNSEFVINSGDTVLLKLNGKTITKTNHSIVNNGILLIQDNGTIKTEEARSLIINSGILTVGVKDGNVSGDSPVIQGATYGIDSTSGLNFYDGIVKGRTEAINGVVNDREESYTVVESEETISGQTYHTATLRAGYMIQFHSNIEGQADEIKQQSFFYDVAQHLDLNTFEKEGYSFANWNTQPNGSGLSYADGANVVNTEWINDDTIHLYAQWKENHYVLMEEPWSSMTDNYVFGNSSYTKDKIATITVRTSNRTPSGAITSWDVSATKNGSVTAWLVPNGDLYDLIIQGNGTISAQNCQILFYGYTNCTAMYLNNLDVSNATEMNSTFSGCSNLTTLEISTWDTSKVVNMPYMFLGDFKLENVDVSHFDTSKVTNMYAMFHSCNKLKSINVSGWDTSNVTDMGGMFFSCRDLTSLNLSSFNTSKVTNMLDIFNGCNSLVNLNIGGFNTHKVTNMGDMFSQNNSLSVITFGRDFTFKGNDISDSAKQAILPTPAGNGYTGKWTKLDNAYGPYTATYLKDNYTENMAGTWIAETEGGYVGDNTSYPIVYNLNGKSCANANPSEYTQETSTFTIKNIDGAEDVFLGWTGSNNLSSGLDQYTISNPYTISNRDNLLGNEFSVIPGETYRVFITAKRTNGSLNMQGGIWYTELTNGNPYDGFAGEYKLFESLNNGWGRYYKDITVPSGKIKGRLYIQLNKSSDSDLTSWNVADLCVIGNVNLSSGLEQYTTTNPYHFATRDSHNELAGNDFPVISGETYRVYITAKRVRGNLNLKGGIWYTELTNGSAWSGYNSDFVLLESLNDGWSLYYKDIVVPSEKTRGKFFVALDQEWEDSSSAWDIANIIVTKPGIEAVITKGSSGIKTYTANWKQNNYSVDGVYYPTLATAYSAITGTEGTIVVERDNTDSSVFTVEAGKTITLDTNGKTITKTTHSITNNGGLIINGEGTIKTTEDRSLIVNTGTLNIGVKDGEVSTTAPVLQGGTYAVETTGTFNFYDGILKGKTDAINGTVSEREPHYTVIEGTETISGQTYHTAILRAGYTINFHSNILPAEYQQVEYIESTGTQYIDTDYFANINTKIELEAMITDTRTDDIWTQITGGRNSFHASSAIQVAYKPKTELLCIEYGTSGVSWSGSTQTISKNTRFTAIVQNDGIYLNGVKGTQNGTFSGTSNYSLWIFDDNNAGVSECKSIARIYSYKIYENGTLVRDFVPCYKTSDNVIGLYDLVTGVFYTNAGTGTFIKGPDTVKTQSFFYGEAQHLTTNTFVSEGYTFTNWNTQPNGSGLSYADGANVVNVETIIDDNIHLYAQWNSNYSVNGRQYLTLATAYSAISGDEGTIIVERDNTDSSEFTVANSKTITLDTNGKTITKAYYGIINSGTLNIIGTGKIYNTVTGIRYVIRNYGELNLRDGVTIEDTEGTRNVMWCIESYAGTVNIHNANILSHSTHVSWGTRGILVGGSTILNVYGGTITASNGPRNSLGIESYANGETFIDGTTEGPATGEINIYGGIIEGTYGISLNSAENTTFTTELKIEGGIIKGTTQGIYVQNTATGNITIKGGTISSTGGQAVFYDGARVLTIGTKDNEAHIDSPTIRGATYGVDAPNGFKFFDGTITGVKNSTTSAYSGTVSESESGYSIIKKEQTISGTTYETAYVGKTDNYQVGSNKYQTLGDAYNYAKTLSGNVEIRVLEDNIDSSVFTVEAGKTVTLNTNSKLITKTTNAIVVNGTLNITGTGKIQSSTLRLISVSQGNLNLFGNVSIETENEYFAIETTSPGKIKISDNAYIESRNSYGLVSTGTGNIEITGGTIKAKQDAVQKGWSTQTISGGNITISGGTIESTNNTGLVINTTAETTITGGTIKGLSGIGVYAGNTGNINITGGTIIGTNSVGIWSASNTFVIGTKDGMVNNAYPIIQGFDIGLYANGTPTIKFYDGIIKGGTAAYNAEPTDVESGYSVAHDEEDIEGVTYQTAFLQILKRILMSETYENAYRDKKIFGQNVFHINDSDVTVKRGDISSITIQENIIAPAGAVVSWDVSRDHNNSVKAWLVPHGSEYDLVIGSYGEIYASSGDYLFYGYEDATSLTGLDNLNTSEVTSMDSMFKNCCSLTSIDVSSLDTSNVTNMKNMFAGIQNVTELDLSTFDTSHVTDMSGMFWNALLLENIDMTNWDTSNVTNMSKLYLNCFALEDANVDKLDTSNVTDMSFMFMECDSLDKLDLRTFDTSNVINMRDMFNGCNSLEAINLYNFDTTNVEDMQHMFSNCGNLKSVLLGDNFDKLNGEEMFDDDTSLEAIITTRTTPQVLTTNTLLDDLDDAILYVPNEEAETAFESGDNYNTVLGEDRIKPILELVGDETITLKKRQEFVDPGVLVADIASGDSGDYAWYGLEQNNTYEKDGEATSGVDTTKVGEYTITYGVAMGSGDNLMSVDRTVIVKNVEITNVTVSGDNFVYTGSAIEPEIIVKNDDEEVLTLGTDYTMVFQDNINVGEATVIVTGAGEYEGEVTKHFTISRKSVTDEDIIITISGDSFEYTGRAIKPEVTVTYGDKTLVDESDYLVDYRNNINAGTATVVIEGIDNYQGEAYVYFTITPVCLEIPYVNGTYVYDRTMQTADLANFSGDLMTASGDKETMAGTYDIIVSLKDKNNYIWRGNTSGDQTITWTILRKPITDEDVHFELEGNTFEYTGAEIKPKVVAILLAEDIDFSVSYENNTYVGTATTTITGINNYEGTVVLSFNIITNKLEVPGITGIYTYTGSEQKARFVGYYENLMNVSGDRATEVGTYDITFSLKDADNCEWMDGTSGDKTIHWTISPKPITDEDVDVIVSGDNFEYTDSPIEPEVIVTRGPVTLVKDTDYTVAYSNNTSAGTATITVTGINNYTDVVTKTFTIKSKELEIPTIDERYVYTGTMQTVRFTNYESNKMTVTGNTGTSAGDYQAVISLTNKDNYKWANGTTDDVTIDWTIEQKSLNGDNITVVTSGDSFVYTGEEICPGVSIKYGQIVLEELTDYIIDYSSNIAVGTATISITGVGNYKDTKTIRFEITKFVLKIPTVNGVYVYSGVEQTVSLNDYYETYMEIISGDKATEVGTYNVELELKDKVNYEWSDHTSGDFMVEWRISNKAITHEDITIQLMENTFEYKGSAITPGVVVKDRDVFLEEGTDYELVYTNNTNVGTGTVTIRGIGNFTGEATREFTITKASLLKPIIAGVYVYNRSTQTASLNFKDESTMYITGDTRTNAGASQIRIELIDKNNYEWDDHSTDDVLLTWIINPKELPSDIRISGSTEYSAGAVEPDIIVKDDGIDLIRGTDFLVEYSNNSNTGIASATITGTGNYAGTAHISFEITKKRVTIPTLDGTYIYNGSLQTASLNNCDETMINVYNNTRTDAGTQQIKVSLKDPTNYIWNDGSTSDKFIEWTIGRKGLTDVTVTLESTLYTYTGDPITPSATVLDGSTLLVNGVDYDIVYEDNVDVGEGKAVVIFKNNYVGTITETFEINGILVTKPTLNGGPYLYNGSEQKAELANVDETFMTVIGDKQTNAGTYTIVISLKNKDRYQWADHTNDDIYINWTISKRTATAPTAIRRTYNGEEQIGISQGVGYTLTGNPTGIDAGNYTATAVLNPNYIWDNGLSGDIVYDWDISKKSVEVVWSDEVSFVYNGSEQAPTVSVVSPIAKETIYLTRTMFINAGEHQSVASIDYVAGGRDKASNYTLTNVTKDFEITRANARLSLDTTSIGVDIGEDRLIGYTYNGDGVLSVTSENSTIARGETDTTNKKVKIYGLAEGVTTITVSATQGTNYNAISERIYVIASDGRPKINSVEINNGATATKNIEVVVKVDASSEFAEVKEMFIGESNVIPADAEWTSYKLYSIYRMSGGNGARRLYIWVKDSRGKIGEMKTASINLEARYTIKLKCNQTNTYDSLSGILYNLREENASYPVSWQTSDTFTVLVPGVTYYAKTRYETTGGARKESAEIKFKIGYDSAGNLIVDEL